MRRAFDRKRLARRHDVLAAHVERGDVPGVGPSWLSDPAADCIRAPRRAGVVRRRQAQREVPFLGGVIEIRQILAGR